MRWPRRVRSYARLSAALVAGVAVAFTSTPSARQVTPKYDLLHRGGHVIDARNGIDGIRDVAMPAATSLRSPRASIRRARKSHRRRGPLRDPGPDRHPRPCLRRAGRARLLRRRQQRLSRRVHLPLRGHGRGRCRRRGLAQLRGVQAIASSTARRPASSPSSTSSARGCAAALRAGHRGHGGAGRRPRWPCRHKGSSSGSRRPTTRARISRPWSGPSRRARSPTSR